MATAPFDLMAELQKAYANQSQASSGLQQRLNEIDQFVNETNPQVIADTLGVDRAFGENPIGVQNSRLLAGKEGGRMRNAAYQDFQGAQSGVFDLLKQIGSVQDSDRDYELDLMKALTEQSATQPKMVLNPETGEMEPDYMSSVQTRLSDMAENRTKRISDFTSIVKELGSLAILANKHIGNTTDWDSLGKGVTGPLATTLGDLTGKDPSVKEFRTAIDTFQDKIRNDLFGSAFTETEKKVAKIPGSAKQEANNKRIIEALLQNKLNSLTIELKNAGFTEPEIQAYLKHHEVNLPESGTNASFEPQTSGEYTIVEVK